MDTKPGDKITVKVGGKEYETTIDEAGVQRFPYNPLFRSMIDDAGLCLNKLKVAYLEGKFSQEEYLNFYLNIGYSVSSFSELESFEKLEIQNPLWD